MVALSVDAAEPRRNICVALQGMRRNGTVDFTLDLVDSLQGSGSYRCTLLNYRGPQPGGVAPRSGLTVRTPSFRGARLLPPPLKARYVGWRRDRTLAAALQDADLVVTASDNGPFLRQTVRIATRLKKPLCCIVHNNLSEKFGLPRHREWSKAQTLELFRRVDKIVCVSRGIRDDLARDLPERAPDILTIANGIDLGRLDRLATEDPGALPGRFFLGVGRLAYEKGFDVLLRAHALALGRGAPAHALVLVGEGYLRAELERLAAELGVRDSVVFRGYAANPFPIMARAAALCTPSRFEGFSLVTAEAAALGVPVISFDCPHGPAEILEHGRFGQLLPPESPERLAAAMAAHLSEPAPLRRKAAASFRARERLSAARCHRRYAALFDDLLRPVRH
jgi:glycosyltransferase involved in cell wall biosynthesis